MLLLKDRGRAASRRPTAEYLADLIFELRCLADASDYRQLTSILESAYAEALRHQGDACLSRHRDLQ
jgi:hypothetical protein